jgi:hypothetical protein
MYLEDIEYKESQDSRYSDYFSLKFVIFNSPPVENEDGELIDVVGKPAWGNCTALITPKSKLKKWIELLDPDLLEEMSEITDEELNERLKHSVCHGMYEHKHSDDGDVFPKVKTLLKAKPSDFKAFEEIREEVEAGNRPSSDKSDKKSKGKGKGKGKGKDKGKPKPEKKPEPEPDPEEPEEQEGSIFPPIKDIRQADGDSLRSIIAQLGLDGSELDDDAAVGVVTLFAQIIDQKKLKNYKPNKAVVNAIKNSIKLLELDLPKKGASPDDVVEMISDSLSDIVFELTNSSEEEDEEDDDAYDIDDDDGEGEEVEIDW